MEEFNSFIDGLGKNLHMQSGECAEHGVAEVLIRVGTPWHCPRCLEQQMAAEAHAIWLADRNSTLFATATIPERYIGQSFIASTPKQKEVRLAVRSFRDFILCNRQWAALIMVGMTGTGKTLLACEFAESLIKNASRSIRYITAKGMISEVQASYGREGKSEEGEIMRFAQYDVLILDEIDALPGKENSALLLTEIINRRYNDNKPVIAITNQPFDHLAKFVGDRVHSRLHENAFLCAFDWQDKRRAA